MIIKIILVCLVLFSQWTIPDSSHANAPVCYSDRIDRIDAVTVNSSGAIVRQRNNVRTKGLKEAVLALQGRSIWVGYANGGFSPNPGPGHLWLHIHWSDDSGSHTNYVEFALAEGHPDFVYAFWYPTLAPNADENGQHYGTHPICGWEAIEIPKATADNIYRLATGRRAR